MTVGEAVHTFVIFTRLGSKFDVIMKAVNLVKLTTLMWLLRGDIN